MIWLLAAFVIGFGFYEVYVSKGQTGTISSYASNAGFSGSDLAIAVAIAYAESGGDASIVGDQTLAPEAGPSYGLWQIDVGTRAHPEYADSDLLDPQTNANAAYEIWQNRGWTEWATYNNGKYLKFLDAGSDEVDNG